MMSPKASTRRRDRTSFVGRARELDALAVLFSESVRLVTLVCFVAAPALDQALVLHLIEDAGEGGYVDRGQRREIGDALAVGMVEGGEHAPHLQRDAMLAELARERRRDPDTRAVDEIGQVAGDIEVAHGIARCAAASHAI